MVADLSDMSIDAFVQTADKPVMLWFYAPWCKQCKLCRRAFEETAKADAVHHGQMLFARLDCKMFPATKKQFGINAYPSFMVFRDGRHRWIELPRNRSTAVLSAAVARELEGPFRWMRNEEELHKALYGQVDDALEEMDQVGAGEALSIAYLPAGADSPAARAYARLAAGCSARNSPLTYVAVEDGSLLAKVGLPPLSADEIAIVKLFSEPADDSPHAEQIVPRIASRPLLLDTAAPDDDTASWEKEACLWALGERLPMVVNFDDNPYWAKRAGWLSFIRLHALLFLSPPHAHLAGVVRAAAARFKRGSVFIIKFMVEGMDTKGNAIMPRFGVKSVLDTPRLVFVDQTLPTDVDRQVVYPHAITEQGIIDFLLSEGIPLASGASLEGSSGKDEL